MYKKKKKIIIIQNYYYPKKTPIPQIEFEVLNQAKLTPLLLMSLCTKHNYPLVRNINFKQSKTMPLNETLPCTKPNLPLV